MSLEQIAGRFAASGEAVARGAGVYTSGSNEAYVDWLYRTVLGRAADPAGRTHWVNVLRAGTGRAAVLVAFSESAEYRAATAGTARATALYTALLRRSPDPGGAAHWAGYLASGQTLADAAAEFLACDEYAAAAIGSLYSGLLGRAAQAGELRDWAAAIATGRATAAHAVQALLYSDEFDRYVAPVLNDLLAGGHVPSYREVLDAVARNRLAPDAALPDWPVSLRGYVTILYIALLRRAPDAAGLETWTNYLAAGHGLEELAGLFLASGEYAAAWAR